jgi:DNA-directed RNA polymerase specialized sigma24 family protein
MRRRPHGSRFAPLPRARRAWHTRVMEWHRDDTHWSMIEEAALGESVARARFVNRYMPVVSAYLGARWRLSAYKQQLDDASQEVFLDCFKEGGALTRADRKRGRFRSFLFGVARTVALRFEESSPRGQGRDRPAGSHMGRVLDDADGPSTVFDRAFALSLVREARLRFGCEADETRARQAELLRVRFEDGRPIRDVAEDWGVDPAWLHREYRRARIAFLDELMAVVGEEHGGTVAEVRRECARLAGLIG